MTRYVVHRLAQTLIVMFGVSVLVFLFLRLSGDPVMLLVPIEASRDEIDAMRRLMGFDDPLYTQYGRFAWRALHGDFGVSLRNNTPAMDLVLQRLPNTIWLTMAALAAALLISLPAGIISATHRASAVDHLAMVLSLLGQALPVFWLGLMLMLIFAVSLGWFPVQGSETARHLVLPAVTLGAAVAGRQTRLVRSSFLEVINREYIRTARAKGLTERVVLLRHALKNAAIPIITILGLDFGGLLGGAVVTETIFAWPGVGRLVVDAISYRDFPIVQAVVFVVSFLFAMINLLVDVSYGFLDPRIRYVD